MQHGPERTSGHPLHDDAEWLGAKAQKLDDIGMAKGPEGHAFIDKLFLRWPLQRLHNSELLHCDWDVVPQGKRHLAGRARGNILEDPKVRELHKERVAVEVTQPLGLHPVPVAVVSQVPRNLSPPMQLQQHHTRDANQHQRREARDDNADNDHCFAESCVGLANGCHAEQSEGVAVLVSDFGAREAGRGGVRDSALMIAQEAR
mmetsp:Transcript_35264/g.80545  ORF Transcript_35264/g.80545 Transcript_35264/m.80545 type:complete len:203 (+) Transcript_35264:2651-3259(+)